MRRLIACLLLGLTCEFGIALGTPREIIAPVVKFFVPAGFDDNDQAEIVVLGEFHNACYRYLGADVTRDDVAKQIKVVVKALDYNQEGVACAEMITPFLETVKIGVLKEGGYRIIINPGTELQLPEKTFHVGKRTTEAADEHFYAPVAHAELILDKETGKQFVTFEGHYPLMKKGCARIVAINLVRDAADLLTVLPIMDIFEDDRCGTNELRFKFNRPVAEPLPKESLLYFRSINGSSYSTIVR
jgi:hypothetical protein